MSRFALLGRMDTDLVFMAPIPSLTFPRCVRWHPGVLNVSKTMRVGHQDTIGVGYVCDEKEEDVVLASMEEMTTILKEDTSVDTHDDHVCSGLDYSDC